MSQVYWYFIHYALHISNSILSSTTRTLMAPNYQLFFNSWRLKWFMRKFSMKIIELSSMTSHLIECYLRFSWSSHFKVIFQSQVIESPCVLKAPALWSCIMIYASWVQIPPSYLCIIPLEVLCKGKVSSFNQGCKLRDPIE